MKNIFHLLALALAITLKTTSVQAQWIQTNGPRVNGFVSQNQITADGDNVYAVCWSFISGGTTIFVSKDKGIDWSKTTNLISTSNYGNPLASNGYVLAAYGSYILKSTDTGASWVLSNTGIPTINALLLKSGKAFAATEDGLYVSTDQGVSWNPTTDGIGTPDIIALAANGTSIFSATSYSGIYRSDDDGLSWIPLNNGLAIPTGSISVEDSLVILNSGINGLFVSDDNGNNWQAKTAPGNSPVLCTLITDTGIYCGTKFNGIFLSTDTGQTWVSVNNGVPFMCEVLTLARNQYNTLFAGTDDGLIASYDNGAHWQPLCNGFDFAWESYSIVSQANKIFANTGIQGVFSSEDSGANWTPLCGGLFDAVNDIIVSGQNVLAIDDVGIFISADSGLSWTLDTGVINGSILATQGNVVFAGTYGSDASGLYRSPDNGISWYPVNSDLVFGETICLNVLQNQIFVASYSGGLYGYSSTAVSADSGLTWSAVNLGSETGMINSFANAGNDYYAVSYNGVILLSTDSGNTWQQQTGNGLNVTLSYMIVADGNNLFLATGSGVFLSSDQGNNWKPVNEGLTSDTVYRLAIIGDKLYAGTLNGGVWERSLSDILGVEELSNTTSLVIYPNPASNQLVIEEEGFNPQRMIIYDVSGKKILDRNFTRQIDISRLVAGFYYIEISNYVTSKQARFVKI